MYMTKADEGHGPKPKKYMVFNETQETSGLYHCVCVLISLCSLTWVLLSSVVGGCKPNAHAG